MNEVDVIKGAREILAAGKWHQGGLSDGKGNCCIFGALRTSAGYSIFTDRDDNEVHRAADALNAQVPNPSRWSEFSLTGYNDDPDTTLQDMLNLIDKTLADMGAL